MAPPRRIWLLKHCRAGDLHQMRHLGGLLGSGWEVEEKQLSFRFPALAYVPGMALLSLDLARSSDLSPPWPAAILAAEALSAKVAVALKTRAAAETKLVVLGRPAGSTEAFDLVLTTRQYNLPAGHNVEELPVPLASPPRAAAEVRQQLLLLMEGKPRPWVALLIGASVAPDILDQSSAENLSAAARGLTLDCRGSLIAVSSPRTTSALENHLRRTLSGADLLQFKPRPGETNLYPAILAEADRFLVTSDSVSMVVEAMSTGKPVTVFMLPQHYPAPMKLVHSMHKHGGLAAPLFRWGVLENPADRAKYFRMLESRNALSIYPRESARSVTRLLEESERLARQSMDKLFT